MYKYSLPLIKLVFKITSKIDAVGLEKIPPEGGCIVAANHIGRLDAMLIYALVPRDDIIMTIAEKYEHIAFTRWVGRAVNAIFIDRFNPDIRSVRLVINRLKKGGILGIAPEGTRSKDETLLEGRPGTAYMASKTGVPVMPVAITGTEDRLMVRNLFRLRRSNITITVGDPFYIPPLDRNNRDEELKAYTDELMCQIAALLPKEYHGVYAEHDRLKELLAVAPSP